MNCLRVSCVDPEKKDTYQEGLLLPNWAPILKTEPSSSHFYTGASRANHTSGRSLHWTDDCLLHRTACPHCITAIWASPNKGVPEIVFQPTELRCSLSYQICAALSPSASSSTNQRSSILTNQDSVFWTNQIARIWSPHIHKDQPIED